MNMKTFKRRLFLPLLLSGLFVLGSRHAFAMGEVATLTFDAGDDGPLTSVIDSSRSFIYYGMTTSPGEVVKVRTSDFASSMTITFAAGTNMLRTSVIDVPNGFAYFGTNTSPTQILKVNISTASFYSVFVTSRTLGPGETGSGAAVIDTGGGFAYFASTSAPAVISKIRLSDLVRVSSLTLSAGDDFVTAAAIDTGGGYAYFGTNTSPGRIVKLRLSDFTIADTLTLASGENSVRSAVLSATNGYAYFGLGTSPGKVIRVRLSDFEALPALTLETNENELVAAVIDSSGTFAYFGTGGIIPNQVIRIQLNTFTRSAATSLSTPGFDVISSAVIDAQNEFAYFSVASAPGKVVKVDLIDTRTGPPIISAAPTSGSVNPGGTLTFTVEPTGSSPFTYQWLKNGVAIPGATSQSYTTPALTLDDNGASYQVTVTNAFGSATSAAAIATVIPVIKVFPNPWRSDRHTGNNLTFGGCASNSTIKVFTLSMHWVKTIKGSGDVAWDLKNDSGQNIASGYYLFLVTTPDDNQTVKGKFAVIR
jgi:hypothetical protein